MHCAAVCTGDVVVGSIANPHPTGTVRGTDLHCAAWAEREKVPRKSPEKWPLDRLDSAERETAGQALMPYARGTPTSVSMVAGGGFEPPTFGL